MHQKFVRSPDGCPHIFLLDVIIVHIRLPCYQWVFSRWDAVYKPCWVCNVYRRDSIHWSPFSPRFGIICVVNGKLIGIAPAGGFAAGCVQTHCETYRCINSGFIVYREYVPPAPSFQPPPCWWRWAPRMLNASTPLAIRWAMRVVSTLFTAAGSGHNHDRSSFMQHRFPLPIVESPVNNQSWTQFTATGREMIWCKCWGIVMKNNCLHARTPVDGWSAAGFHEQLFQFDCFTNG